MLAMLSALVVCPAFAQTLSNGQSIIIEGAQGSRQYHDINVPDGASDLVISITGGTGAADLYTRYGSNPNTRRYDCAPLINGNEETCTEPNPEAGTHYIMIYGYYAFEDVTLTASYSDGSSSGGSGSDVATNLDSYYSSAEGLSGYALKSALHDIIDNHNDRSYGDLWTFLNDYDIDNYYENDGTILDIYSENPSGRDDYNFTRSSDQCGNYGDEGDCYNREHSFPKSWFDDDYPMYTDIHHIFASDGYVNGRRSNYPFGEVSSSSWTSENGSRLGTGPSSLGYSGTVFEPIDEFKGDLARAYFYMATRYEDVIDDWDSNSNEADAVLDGSRDQVFEDWVIDLLLDWHNADPVSEKERDRNDAAQGFQSNRNPFVDHPELVELIW